MACSFEKVCMVNLVCLVARVGHVLIFRYRCGLPLGAVSLGTAGERNGGPEEAHPLRERKFLPWRISLTPRQGRVGVCDGFFLWP